MSGDRDADERNLSEPNLVSFMETMQGLAGILTTLREREVVALEKTAAAEERKAAALESALVELKLIRAKVDLFEMHRAHEIEQRFHAVR